MKKVFISADIEGISFCVTSESTKPGGHEYERCRREMTNEVLAAAEGAREAGADLVVIKDAHGCALNIYPEEMPEYVQLIRGWLFEPKAMIEGLDESFSCAMFVGYHSAAGQEGNSRSHTLSGRVVQRISVNGVPCSEFLIYSWLASYYKVPTVLLTGDRALCESSAPMHPKLFTVSAKEAVGDQTLCYSPSLVCSQIRDAARQAVSQNLENALCTLPEHFSVEIDFHDHSLAARKSFYPGMVRSSAKVLRFETDDWYEVCRMLCFVVL